MLLVFLKKILQKFLILNPSSQKEKQISTSEGGLGNTGPQKLIGTWCCRDPSLVTKLDKVK